METKYTREQIQQIVASSLNEVSANLLTQFTDEINNLSKLSIDITNEPLAREIVAISIAQSNIATVIVDVLYELLNQ